MSAQDRKHLERFADLYDQAEVSLPNNDCTSLYISVYLFLTTPPISTETTHERISALKHLHHFRCTDTPTTLVAQCTSAHLRDLSIQRRLLTAFHFLVVVYHGSMSWPQVYYAYDIIHTAVLSPFKKTHAMTLFNCARFLLMRMMARDVPRGVSMVHVVHTLAEHAMALGAYKLARFAYNKLQVRASIELNTAWLVSSILCEVMW